MLIQFIYSQDLGCFSALSLQFNSYPIQALKLTGGLIRLYSNPHFCFTAIRKRSPNAEIQFYQTWGRPYGEEESCPTFPANCDYFTMQDVITGHYSDYACQFRPARVAPVII